MQWDIGRRITFDHSLLLQNQKRYICQVSNKLHGARFGEHVCIYITIPIWMV
jgi:hypothetical protein